MADIYLAIIACRLAGAGALSRQSRGRRATGGGRLGEGGARAQAAAGQVRDTPPHCVNSTLFS